MSKQEIKKEEKPEELIRAKKLIDEGKNDEALELMKHFEEKEEHPLQDIVSCHLLKCNLLFQQGKYEDVIKLAEQTYEESLGLGKNLLSIDALMLMPHPLLWLNRLDKAFDIIKQGEELLKSLTQELATERMQREADIAYNKANLYLWGTNEVDLALEQAERSLALREEFGSKQKISQSLIQMAWIIGIGKGELDRALKYAKRALSLSEESNNKYNVAWSLNTIGMLHGFKGELDRSIQLFEQGLLIFKELNNKWSEAWALNNMGESYRMRGELDRAIECLEQGLSLSYEMGNLLQTAILHDYLIQFLVENGEIKRAQRYLHDFEQLKNQMENKPVDLMYLLNKALILKTNPRASNQGKAEEILKHILEDEDFEYEIYIRATLNLCELLLIKFSNNNNLKIIDEIQKYINQIIAIAKNSHSYWLLAETNILQAKLELLTLDLNKAKESLIRTQQIAEEYGLNQLTERISIEQDKLFSYTNKWVSSKNSAATIVELSNLAPLKEQIQYMLKKREILKRINI